MKKRNMFLLACFLCGVILVFQSSRLPEPDTGSKIYFPIWLGSLINANMHKAVPFFFLGLISEYFYPDRPCSPLRRNLLNVTILITIVTLAEIGLFFLPHRRFDFFDMLWRFGGSASGIVGAMLIKHFTLTLDSIQSEHPI